MSTALKPWIGDPPHQTAPEIPGYVQTMHVRLELGKAAIVGLILLPIWAFIFGAAVAVSGGPDSYSITIDLIDILLVLPVIIAVAIVHEAIHGLVAVVFRARPSFGLGAGFFYTTFRNPLNRRGYLWLVLAPLVIISAASIVIAILVPVIAGWALFFSLVNVSGAGGDLLMTNDIRKLSPDALFHDLADGFAVYLPEQQAGDQ